MDRNIEIGQVYKMIIRSSIYALVQIVEINYSYVFPIRVKCIYYTSNKSTIGKINSWSKKAFLENFVLVK